MTIDQLAEQQQSQSLLAYVCIHQQSMTSQIAELRTANMRLENENESLLALEERAAVGA